MIREIEKLSKKDQRIANKVLKEIKENDSAYFECPFCVNHPAISSYGYSFNGQILFGLTCNTKTCILFDKIFTDTDVDRLLFNWNQRA